MNKGLISKKRFIIKILAVIVVIAVCLTMFIITTNAGAVSNLKIQINSQWPGKDGKGIYHLYKSEDHSYSNILARVNANDWKGEVIYNVIGEVDNYNMVQVESPKYGKAWIFIGDGKGPVSGIGYNFISTASTGWMWPAPNCRTITSGYGKRGSEFHDGIDISKSGGSYGETIVATRGGTVIHSAFSNTAGNWIVIDHGDGISSVYMHCSSRLVSAGQKVNQGQMIGKIGNTGNSSGAHLHFTVCKTSTALSPPRSSYCPTNYVKP